MLQKIAPSGLFITADGCLAGFVGGTYAARW